MGNGVMLLTCLTAPEASMPPTAAQRRKVLVRGAMLSVLQSCRVRVVGLQGFMGFENIVGLKGLGLGGVRVRVS